MYSLILDYGVAIDDSKPTRSFSICLTIERHNQIAIDITNISFPSGSNVVFVKCITRKHYWVDKKETKNKKGTKSKAIATDTFKTKIVFQFYVLYLHFVFFFSLLVSR